MRQIPFSSKGSSSEQIYYIWRADGGGPEQPGTFVFDKIRRQICFVRGHFGRFVRYDSGLRRLHDSKDLAGLLREIRGRKGYTSGAFKRAQFNKNTDVSLPFIKDWEQPVGRYPRS